MKISFSTLGCPDFAWTDIYTMAKDFGFHGIEIRGLGGDIFDVNSSPFSEANLEKTKAQLEVLSENYIVSERFLKEKQGNMVTEQEEYKRLKSWADVYDRCSFEAKKVFISHFVKAIYVYRDYDLEIEFNVSFEEFKHFSAN